MFLSPCYSLLFSFPFSDELSINQQSSGLKSCSSRVGNTLLHFLLAPLEKVLATLPLGEAGAS
jgi:hypothetical protein